MNDSSLSKLAWGITAFASINLGLTHTMDVNLLHELGIGGQGLEATFALILAAGLINMAEWADHITQ